MSEQMLGSSKSILPFLCAVFSNVFSNYIKSFSRIKHSLVDRHGSNFIEHNNLLSIDKDRIKTKFVFVVYFLLHGIQLLFAYPDNHEEIWLVILFSSRKTFPAKQVFVLSSFMKFCQLQP